MSHIKNFWDSQADKGSHDVSWRDICAINLEIKTVGKYIDSEDTVLDVGCANGYSTIRQNGKHLTGIDFSEAMIKQAMEHESAKFHFEVGDVKDIQFEKNHFDVVYTTRCLINLPTWEEQKRGIKECLRVARKRVIISEGFYEPFNRLNAIRQIAGLPLLEEHDFNRYIKQDKLEIFLDSMSYTIDDFSSTYYLGSRFIRELVTYDKSYTNPINNMFYGLSKDFNSEGFGIQMIYIINL